MVPKINTVGVKMGEFSYLKDHPKKYNNFDEFFFNRNLNIDIKQNEQIVTQYLSIFLMFLLLIGICYKKGEKPKWQWGSKKE